MAPCPAAFTSRAVLALALAAFLLAPAAARAQLRVVTSILPIESLAAGVMAGAGAPRLLVGGGRSPHGFALRPSDLATLVRAELIVRVGPGLDDFLDRPLAAQAEGAPVLTLMAAPGVALRPWKRAGGSAVVEADGTADRGEIRAGVYDPHIWLDPANAIAIARDLAAELARLDPARADLYAANARALARRIEALDADLAELLDGVGETPYLVFHDAYGYLEARYRLAGAIALSPDPERKPGARRIAELRARIVAGEIGCVLAEPQYSRAVIETLVEGTDARTATLDPLGAGLTPGADAYFALMRGLARTLAACAGG